MTDLVDGAFKSFQDIKEEEFFRRDLPPDVIESIGQLTDAFSRTNPREREEIVERVQAPFRFIFGRYAFCVAQEAIRRNDPSLVKQGLIALAIENTFRDWRDTLPILALLFRSACKLNLNASGLFYETAQIACPPCRRLLEGFMDRDESARTIESFRYKEVGEGDTFAYVYVEPSYQRPSRAKLRWEDFFGGC